MGGKIIRLFLLLILLLGSTGGPAIPGDTPFIELPYELRPFSDMTADYDSSARNTEGDPYFLVSGQESVHPGNMAILGISSLNNYFASGDAGFLEDAETVAENLRENSVMVNGARLFYYDFAFNLHDGPDVMTPPWYSCYAQGLALAFFSRLYEFTGDAGHLETASQINASFLLKKGESDIWITSVENNETWFEEYPLENPSHVLNGMIAGIFGLYEYFLNTRDPGVAELLGKAISTIKNHAYDYRRPGELSYYCLGHRVVVGVEYHQTHIKYFDLLCLITGDAFFQKAADDFQDDLNAWLDEFYESDSACFVSSLFAERPTHGF